jgi:hypothetical protein
MSLRQISRKLKVKWNTVKDIAVSMNLAFPRVGPTHTVYHSTAGRDKHPCSNKKQLSDSVSAKRDLFRAEWLAIRKRYPNAGRKQLNVRLASRQYNWLRKHDKKWLLSQSPPPIKRIGSARVVDWNKRDAQLAKKIYAAALRLRNNAGQPIRITKQAIARNIDEKTSLNYKKALNKLPLTIKALNKVVESRIDFAIRRINWSAEHFRKQNIIPAFSTLGQHTRLNHSIWHIPEVKTAFDRAILSLQREVSMNQFTHAQEAEATIMAG